MIKLHKVNYARCLHFNFVSRITIMKQSIIKPFALLLMSSLILVQCKQKVQLEIIHFPDGQISRTIETVNKKKHGIMTDYYFGGNIKSIRTFKDDLQHGKSSYYFAQGQLKEVQYYENGMLQDADSIWNEIGQLTTVTHYKNGLKNGKFLKFDSTGKVKFSAVYSMDSLTEVNGLILAQ